MKVYVVTLIDQDPTFHVLGVYRTHDKAWLAILEDYNTSEIQNELAKTEDMAEAGDYSWEIHEMEMTDEDIQN